MSSACEVVNVEGFESKLNLRRLELDDNNLISDEGCFHVDQMVKAICKEKGQTLGKVKRFIRSGGMYHADVEFTINALKFLKMIAVIHLEAIETARALDLNLSRRRQEAMQNGQSLAL